MSEKNMSNNFKCSKCGKDAYTYPIKGSNNTKLCDKCGDNICFVCGKKETKKEEVLFYELLRVEYIHLA